MERVWTVQRRDFVAEVIRHGWTVVRADEGFVVAEAGDRYQLTGWFVGGRLGLIDLYDAVAGAGRRLPPPWAVPSPSAAATELRRRDP